MCLLHWAAAWVMNRDRHASRLKPIIVPNRVQAAMPSSRPNCSASSWNAVRNHPGIAFILSRIPRGSHALAALGPNAFAVENSKAIAARAPIGLPPEQAIRSSSAGWPALRAHKRDSSAVETVSVARAAGYFTG